MRQRATIARSTSWLRLARRRNHLKDNTLRQYRDNLFTFMSGRDVPPTNNGSEQAIRPSTTFRKVTGGFRSNWGAGFYASVRPVLNTGRRQDTSAFQSIQAVIVEEPLIQTG
jgi:transposase